MTDTLSKLKAFTSSFTVRLFLIGFLILILLIPLVMIGSLVYEREARYQTAKHEVGSKWGQSQTVLGPVLTVPYFGPVQGGYSALQQVYILPESLEITSTVDPEVRSRGIFDVLLYDTEIKMKGVFPAVDTLDPSFTEKNIRWAEASLLLSLSDLRGLKENQGVWKEKAVAFKPLNTLDNYGTNSTQSILKANTVSLKKGEPASFEITLNLQGSEKLFFTPVAKKTKVIMDSSWPTPSFAGAFLPEEREISEKGFSATWDIPPFGKAFSSYWLENSGTVPLHSASSFQSSSFGVDLFFPTDFYQKVTRSVKYGLLFVVFTFLTFFLFEVIYRLKVHPFQYLLVGFALSVFYLLLLSLSEHIDFPASYLISSVATIGLITAYCLKVLQSKKRGLIVGLVLVVLYTYLYFLLGNDDYALLIGSVSLFLALALIMYLTRNINWYQVEEKNT